MSLLLAGDVGGTKTTLACYRAGRDHLELLRRASFPSRSFSCLKEVLDAFMEGFDAPLDAAVLGVAGPVVDGTATITNLPWKVDERELAVILKTARTSVVNDLVAVSYGILDLSAGDLFTLNDVPRDPRGPIAVIAPGTGLGVGPGGLGGF
ncbi:MAG TPA: glucokinase, partial [Deltaproteobacteria bacterium]|nr:glucokinase [Deltaproteobacteria bacterium]